MDYSSLGLRIGLEIHQQLASGKKLFCGCPVPSTTDERNTEFPTEVRRKLRPVAGETGITDVAALHEFLKDKTFVYKINPESSCLVEIDEQPPKPLNIRALETVLQVCRLLNCKILDEIHVMRKTVIDGSAVSGFQRTAFVGMNGYIETSLGEVGIRSISLEEDAAAPFGDAYRLDRLGIPLIEIATSSDIKSPGHAKEVAENIGLLLRSTEVVRGIGSIRQDINISIEGGARVEIKGFQDLDIMPDIIEDEIQRQLALLEIKNGLLQRGAVPFEPKTKIVTELFRNTGCSFIKKFLDRGDIIVAGKLPLFAGLLKRQCGSKTLGKDLSEHALGYGITHSDEDLDKYNLRNEFNMLKEELKAGERDAVFIVAGSREATNLVFERANHCLIGVPEETRVADGTSSRYTRPLPGAGRMYPESDIPPIKLAQKYVDSIKIPKTLLELKKELSTRMPAELASQIIRSRYFKDFETLSKNYDAILVATIFLSYFRDMSRRNLKTEAIKIHDLDKMLSSVKDGTVPKDAVPEMLEKLASGENIVKVLSSCHSASGVEIMSLVREAIAQNPGKKESVIMGIVMQQLRGRASGEKVMKIVKEELSKSS